MRQIKYICLQMLDVYHIKTILYTLPIPLHLFSVAGPFNPLAGVLRYHIIHCKTPIYKTWSDLPFFLSNRTSLWHGFYLLKSYVTC